MSKSKDIGFVAYRLPNDRDHYVCHIQSIQIRDESTDVSLFDFIIAPFDKANRDSFLLKFSKVSNNSKLPQVQLTSGTFTDVVKDDYLTTCQKLINKLSKEDISKVVLSRTKSIDSSEINLNDLFFNMKAKYPKAFVYVFHHPHIGTWAAATPELLLSSIDGNIETVALAGTRKYNSLNDAQWGLKEIEEHKYIERYISEKLDEKKIPYNKSETFTQKAGNIEHIKSVYKIQLDNNDFIDITDTLHPGPAISGYPVEDAMKVIKEIESHDRLFYCGYLGPLNHETNKHIYINLRCMEIFSIGYKIYIGGGITSASKAEDEWTETKLKSETLSDLLLSTHYEDHQ